jgi:hypothetical protein
MEELALTVDGGKETAPRAWMPVAATAGGSEDGEETSVMEQEGDVEVDGMPEEEGELLAEEEAEEAITDPEGAPAACTIRWPPAQSSRL